MLSRKLSFSLVERDHKLLEWHSTSCAIHTRTHKHSPDSTNQLGPTHTLFSTLLWKRPRKTRWLSARYGTGQRSRSSSWDGESRAESDARQMSNPAHMCIRERVQGSSEGTLNQELVFAWSFRPKAAVHSCACILQTLIKALKCNFAAVAVFSKCKWLLESGTRRASCYLTSVWHQSNWKHSLGDIALKWTKPQSDALTANSYYSIKGFTATLKQPQTNRFWICFVLSSLSSTDLH